MFGLFKKRDPVCGMKKEESKGIEEEDKWFCSNSCLEKYKEKKKKTPSARPSCCGGH